MFVRQLAYEWAKLDLPTQHLKYTDYIRALTSLQASTKNMSKTRLIFTAILHQATHLARSSEWVERELRFEALAELIEDRTETLLLALTQGGAVYDAALDLYNERASRLK